LLLLLLLLPAARVVRLGVDSLARRPHATKA
jgi:hypothetical protein